MSGTEQMAETPSIAEVGDTPSENQSKDIFRLDVSKWVHKVIPEQYFLTSGEAVSKTEKLIEDLQNALKGAKKMYVALLEARRDNKYLETEMDNKHVLLRIKNPRSDKVRRKLKKVSIQNFKDFISYGDLLMRKRSDSKDREIYTYCAIDPDAGTYTYFNTYDSDVGENQSLKRKKVPSTMGKFVEKLEKRGYEKVLI